MRLIFMGTPEFAVPSLQQLADVGHLPVAVVTGPDRKQGRGQQRRPSPVKAAAIGLGIETILQPESVRDPAFARDVAQLKPDLIVVVAFRILPPEVYSVARLGAFNLHGSLLPRYRGAAPIHHAVLNGDSETGVTTFFLKEKVDTGHVILQRTMQIGPDETTGDVYDRMKLVGADAVVETVRAIEAGTVVEQPQDDTQATAAPKVYSRDGCVDWSRGAAEVHNRIRGFSPFPGAWTLHNETRLKLLRSRVASTSNIDPESHLESNSHSRKPGQILVADGRLIVACASGAVEIVELQQQGRRSMAARNFLQGYTLGVGDTLVCPPEGESGV